VSHSVRIRPDPGWAIGTLWQPSEQTALDDALFASVDGDEGGTWNPAAPIFIGGAGLRLVGSTPHTLTGAASGVTTSLSTPLTHNDSDYVSLAAGHPGASVSICSPIAQAVWETNASNGYEWKANNLIPPTEQVFVYLLSATQIAQLPLATCRVPLHVHDGAVLSTVTFPFVVLVSSGAVPSTLPSFGVFAVDRVGNKYPLSATPYQFVPVPASPSAWWDNSLVQTLTFTADSEGDNPCVLMNKSVFSYFAEIVGASSAISGGNEIVYFDAIANFIDVPDIRPR
jgi:hypothetical protein